MTKKRFEQEYCVKLAKLTFKPHYSSLYEVAEIGEYAVYHSLKEDDYSVILNGSVLHWRVNLGSLTA